LILFLFLFYFVAIFLLTLLLLLLLLLGENFGHFSKNICLHMLNLHWDACCVLLLPKLGKKKHCLALGFFFSFFSLSMFEHYPFSKRKVAVE
jgi:hypothetical protein